MSESADRLADNHIDAAHADFTQLRNAGGDIDAARRLAATMNSRHGLQPVRLTAGARVSTPGWIAVIGTRGISIWTPEEEKARQKATEGSRHRERGRVAQSLGKVIPAAKGTIERGPALELLWERLDFCARMGKEAPRYAASLGRVAESLVTQHGKLFEAEPSAVPEHVIRGAGWTVTRQGDAVTFRWDDTH